jgi:hypothetical protein
LIFEITEERAALRFEWVKDRRAELGSLYKLPDIIIVDETIFKEGTHPKGKQMSRSLSDCRCQC